MKRSNVICLFAGVGLLVGAAASFTTAQPDLKDVKKDVKKAVQPAKDAKPTAATPSQPAGDAKKMPSKEELDAAWMKAMELNEHHERFKVMEGNWDCAMKFWEPGSTEPQTGAGSMTNTLIHGGRYIQHEFKGEFMGMAFTGSGVFGYNNVTQKYEGTWCDNMSTAVMFSTGTYDEATKTYTINGEFEMTGMGKIKQRDVTTVTDNNKHTMVMYHQMGTEPEVKVMELTYTRAKATEKSATDATLDKARKEVDKLKDKIPTGK
ncbi:MAG: DUF1579 domain-containing protein [Pyrinomonadaceae bacterium]|nr:DUF1579 domain-containing protein [Phycisphaerales bacterium]